MIENNIHQTKNQSRQDALNYGIKVNNRLAYLLVDQGSADARPTTQAEEVRVQLTKEVDKELKDLKAVLQANAPLLKKAF